MMTAATGFTAVDVLFHAGFLSGPDKAPIRNTEHKGYLTLTIGVLKARCQIHKFEQIIHQKVWFNHGWLAICGFITCCLYRSGR